MKNLLRFLLLLAVGLFGSGSTLSAARVALPEDFFPELKVLLADATRQSPRMVSRAIDLEIAENNRIWARSAILPSLGASVGYYKSDDDQEYLYKNSSSSISSYRVTKTPYSVTLSQPLFHWGERRNQVRIGEISLKIAQGQYQEAYRLLAAEVRTSYLRLILSKYSLERSRFYARVVADQVTEAEGRWKAKVVSDAELAAVRLSSERANLAAEQAEMDYEISKASLARLSGTPVLKDSQVPDRIEPIPYDESTLSAKLALFLSQSELPTAEATILRNQLQIEKLNVANAKTRLRPKVNAVLGYTQDQQNNLYGTIDNYVVTSIYGGISVSWTIFDGFASNAAVKNSLARQRQFDNDYRAMHERLGSTAQNLLKQLYFLNRTMVINDRIERETRQALQAIEADRARGSKSEADVNQGKLSVRSSEYAAMSTRVDFLLKTVEFLGVLNEDPVTANLTN